MTLRLLVAIFIVLFLLYPLTSAFLQYRKLRHIRGPFIASISPIWLLYHCFKGDLYLAVESGLRKYGSPLRVAPGIIATDDPVIQRAMVDPRDKTPFTKGPWFEGMKFDPRIDNILSMTDEKAHTEMRNKLIPGYTGKEVPTLEIDVDNRVVELLDFIKNYANKNESFDIARAIAFFTMDVLTQIAFGEKLGFLVKNDDCFNYLASSTAYYPLLDLGNNSPFIHNILTSRIMSGAQPKPTDRVGFGAILGHTQAVIASRFGPDAKLKGDMLGSFVKHGLTQVECESEALLQILAGSDSTATGLRTTFLCILTSPYAYLKLLNEIQVAVKKGKITRPIIKNDEAKVLPYLQACVKEGLRMFVPLQGLAGRCPPKGGATIGNTFIPEGTEVGVAIYAMMRREDIFGHDADTFRPERWIDNDPATIEKMSKVQELIFGAGRSSCLGKQIALMEMSKSIFEVFNAFDLTIVNPFKPMSTSSHSVVVQKNFFVRAYPRKS